MAKRAWVVVMAVVSAMALAGCTRSSKPRYFSELEEAALADAFMKLPTPEGAKEPAVALAIVADAGTGRYLLLRVRTSGKKEEVNGLALAIANNCGKFVLSGLGQGESAVLSLQSEAGQPTLVQGPELGKRDNPRIPGTPFWAVMLGAGAPSWALWVDAYPHTVRDDPTTPGGKVIFQMVGFRSETLPARVRARVDVGKLLFGTEIRVEQTVQDGWLDVLPLSQFVSDPLR
ncbi:MAG: hypothetical protein U0638_07480 [Phycisphaerales bacterium]